MKKHIQGLLLIAIVAVTACQSPKEKALKNIENLETRDSVFSIENMGKLKEEYISFADKYPDDEHAPVYLFKAAQSCNVMASQFNDSKQHEAAVKIFDRVRKDYPKHEMAEEAMFLTGYIYENHLGDTSKAKVIYSEFITTYPNGELAEEAKLALKNMSIPLEQLIRQQPLQKEDTAVFVEK